MNLYAESSAVLAWLMGEESGEEVRGILAGAQVVFASDLTLIECHRVLVRSVALRQIREAAASGRRAILAQAASHWNLLRLDPEIVERSSRPFPQEPIRTLDAIHLASALLVRSAVPEVALLALDQRIRKNALELGLRVIPTKNSED